MILTYLYLLIKKKLALLITFYGQVHRAEYGYILLSSIKVAAFLSDDSIDKEEIV